MIQADDGFSSRDPAPSTGQDAEMSRPAVAVKIDRISSRPVSGATATVYLNEGTPDWRADIIQELVAGDVDRLDTIMGRAADLKRLLGILLFAPGMNDEAQTVLSVIAREVDAIYAIAVQPSLTVEYVL